MVACAIAHCYKTRQNKCQGKKRLDTAAKNTRPAPACNAVGQSIKHTCVPEGFALDISKLLLCFSNFPVQGLRLPHTRPVESLEDIAMPQPRPSSTLCSQHAFSILLHRTHAWDILIHTSHTQPVRHCSGPYTWTQEAAYAVIIACNCIGSMLPWQLATHRHSGMLQAWHTNHTGKLV